MEVKAAAKKAQEEAAADAEKRMVQRNLIACAAEQRRFQTETRKMEVGGKDKAIVKACACQNVSDGFGKDAASSQPFSCHGHRLL